MNDYVMITNTLERYYILRPSRDNSGKVTIYLRAYVNGQVALLGTTGVKIDPKKNWCKKSKTVINPDNDLDVANLAEKLESCKSVLNEIVKYHNKQDILLDKQTLVNEFERAVKNRYKFKGVHNVSVIELYEWFIEKNTRENEESFEGLAHNTIRDYRHKKDKLKSWIEIKKYSTLVQKWNVSFVEEYKEWLKKNHENSNSSANKHIMRLKNVFKESALAGKIKNNPLKEVSTPQKCDKNLVHLEWEWVQKLREHPFKSQYKKVVDMYIFSCCTGICYADLIKLKDSNLIEDEINGLTIKDNRKKKRRSEYTTPVWSYAKDIIEEFGGIEKIPKISNQKANEYIKIALHLISYPEAEEITFHTGRKTFINYCLNDLLIEPYVIKTYTGHKDIKEIERYAKLNTKNAMNIFRQKVSENS